MDCSNPPRDDTHWEGDELPSEGVLYIGDEGVMFNDRILNKERAKKFEDVPKTLPRRGQVMKEWLEAVRGGEPAGSNFPYAMPILEFVLLGVLAIRSRKPVEFDPDACVVKNNPDANELLKANYQNGWAL